MARSRKGRVSRTKTSKTPKRETRPASQLFLEAVKDARKNANRELAARVGKLAEIELQERGMDKDEWAIDLDRGIWVQVLASDTSD